MNTRAYIYEGLAFEAQDFLPARKNPLWQYIKTLCGKIKARVVLAEAVRRERVQLSRMSDRMLKDIGITNVDAVREINRSYFDVTGIRY